LSYQQLYLAGIGLGGSGVFTPNLLKGATYLTDGLSGLFDGRH
jgi:hypothetical protein